MMIVKFQSDWKSLNPNLAALRLHKVLRQDVCPLVHWHWDNPITAVTVKHTLGWMAPKTATSATPVLAVSDLAHASIPLAQTPWGLTGRAWLQAEAQQAVIAVVPSFNSLGINSLNITE